MSGFLNKIFNKNKPEITQEQLRFLSQSIILEESRNPEVIKLTLKVISIGVITVLLWSAFAKVEEIAKAPGEVIPQGKVQQIQHFDGGIIKEILVKEGEIVQKNQPLVILDGAGTTEDAERIRIELSNLRLQAERLKAFIEDRDMNFAGISPLLQTQIEEQKHVLHSMFEARNQEKTVITSQIDQKQQELEILEQKRENLINNLKLSEDAFVMQEELFKKGLVSKIKFLEEQKNINTMRSELKENKNQIEGAQKAIEEFNSKLSLLNADANENAYKELDKVNADITTTEEILKKSVDKMERLNIMSPVKGIVKNITFHTIGGVIQPGQILMEIVPLDEKLIVEAQIMPKDIGHIIVGQKVNIKVSAFEFARYGAIKGHLIYVSPTTFESDQKQHYYKARIELKKNYVGNDPSKNIIVPGMTVESEIITGKKTILSYLVKPVHFVTHNAFKER
jgi:HlyD family secretion protein/adhesin transport system membrane fusion protein